jgi:hypothetical protein
MTLAVVQLLCDQRLLLPRKLYVVRGNLVQVTTRFAFGKAAFNQYPLPHSQALYIVLYIFLARVLSRPIDIVSSKNVNLSNVFPCSKRLQHLEPQLMTRFAGSEGNQRTLHFIFFPPVVLAGIFATHVVAYNSTWFVHGIFRSTI